MIDGESKIIDGLTDGQRKIIDSHFTSGAGLYRDVMNIWAPLPMFVNGDSIDDDFLADITPLPRYAEYIHARQYKYTPAEIDYIFQKSAPKAIVKFDALIDEYNADLERIRMEKDGKKIHEFVKRAEALFEKPLSETI